MNRGLSLGCMYFGNGYREGLKMREFCQMGRDEVTVLEALAAADGDERLFEPQFDADHAALTAFWRELGAVRGVVFDQDDRVVVQGSYAWTSRGDYLCPVWDETDSVFVPEHVFVALYPHAYRWFRDETGYEDDVAEQKRADREALPWWVVRDLDYWEHDWEED